MVPPNLLGEVSLDGNVFVPIDLLDLIPPHDEVPIAPDPLAAIVPDPDVEVLFPVDEHLFLTLLVLDADLVEAVAPRRAVRLEEDGLRLVLGQRIGRHLLSVVKRADDDRSVGVALLEVDDDLLTNPRNEDHSPSLAGETLRHPDPARAVLIRLAIAVPMELDLHPPVLVGPDLLAGGTDYDRRLRPLHDGPGGDPGGPKLLPSLQHGEQAVVGRPLVARRLVGIVLQLVLGAHDEVFALLVPARSIGEVEGPPDGDLAHVALGLGAIELGEQLVDACPSIELAARPLAAPPRTAGQCRGGAPVARDPLPP